MCDSCEVLTINGVYCHELGCPEAWKDEKRSCLFCGQIFIPEDKEQLFCDKSCGEEYTS
jgi:hypothetical protein